MQCPLSLKQGSLCCHLRWVTHSEETLLADEILKALRREQASKLALRDQYRQTHTGTYRLKKLRVPLQPGPEPQPEGSPDAPPPKSNLGEPSGEPLVTPRVLSLGSR
jgi:hypothetical protein